MYLRPRLAQNTLNNRVDKPVRAINTVHMANPSVSPLCAFDVHRDGHCTPIDLRAGSLTEADGYRWIHLDLNDTDTKDWLRANVPIPVVEALTQSETRPRCMLLESGLFLTLRGVNLNPGANSDDMVSIRLWATEQLVISARVRKIWAVDAMREKMASGVGPRSAPLFLAELCHGLTKRIEKVSLELVERTDELEEDFLIATRSAGASLATIRQSVIKLRRFVRPQNEAMSEFASGSVWPLDEECANLLRETANRTTRIVEELDATSDRLQALQDHADMLHAATLGRNSYVLSVVAAIFLPLGFLTGLFGINVGGMPGLENAFGFWAVTVSSAVLGVVLYLVFRFLKWL